MTLKERIESFAALGKIISDGISFSGKRLIPVLEEAIEEAAILNSWFTHENVVNALSSIAEELTIEKLTSWLDPYHHRIEKLHKPRIIATVMAGNIPLAGFHDFLCILVTGNKIVAKLSSYDKKLLPALGTILTKINPEWGSYFAFTEEILSSFDAVIATGSNNTSRYFDYYFSKFPHIIRRNRNGVAVISGQESTSDLNGLADDIFLYFGLGCRSVSKLFVPEKYDFRGLVSSFSQYESYSHHNKYLNNYEYYKSIYLINRTPFIDGGFFMMKEDLSVASPISVIYYELYSDKIDLETRLFPIESQLQCIVSSASLPMPTIKPGRSQHPGLGDYADGVDTLDFLLN